MKLWKLDKMSPHTRDFSRELGDAKIKTIYLMSFVMIMASIKK